MGCTECAWVGAYACTRACHHLSSTHQVGSVGCFCFFRGGDSRYGRCPQRLHGVGRVQATLHPLPRPPCLSPGCACVRLRLCDCTYVRVRVCACVTCEFVRGPALPSRLCGGGAGGESVRQRERCCVCLCERESLRESVGMSMEYTSFDALVCACSACFHVGRTHTQAFM